MSRFVLISAFGLAFGALWTAPTLAEGGCGYGHQTSLETASAEPATTPMPDTPKSGG